ncbi:hypothetical protein BH10BAC3_BH10BAC3_13470 [soil metagenome]
MGNSQTFITPPTQMFTFGFNNLTGGGTEKNINPLNSAEILNESLLTSRKNYTKTNRLHL